MKQYDQNFAAIPGFYTKGRPLVKSNLICPSDKLGWQLDCPFLNINMQRKFLYQPRKWLFGQPARKLSADPCIRSLGLNELKYLRAWDQRRQQAGKLAIFKVKVEWSWRYRSRSKVITYNTPSHASDHLFQIWKESIQNCKHYRVDTIFKVKNKWHWKYRSRSKVIIWDTPSDANDDSCQIWKEYKKNCRFF